MVYTKIFQRCKDKQVNYSFNMDIKSASRNSISELGYNQSDNRMGKK